MLAEELLVLNDETPLWQQARFLVNAALRLEQNDASYIWHGWQKAQIGAFLHTLPDPCSLVVGVWGRIPATASCPSQEKLVLGVVCEVVEGVIRSICGFERLVAAGLKPVDTLEIGLEDALEIMHYARKQVAPVAWALFTEQATWNTWLFTADEDGGALDKGELLRTLARKGDCVLMGSQAASHGFV